MWDHAAEGAVARMVAWLKTFAVAIFSSPIPLFALSFLARCGWLAIKASFSSVCGGAPGGTALSESEANLKKILNVVGTVLNRLGTAFWFSAFTAVGVSWENSAAAIAPPPDPALADEMGRGGGGSGGGGGEGGATQARSVKRAVRQGGCRTLYRCLRAKHSSKRSCGYYLMVVLYVLIFYFTSCVCLNTSLF